MKDPKDDKKVGYCSPPANTRFAKGRSGNPAGRPKGKSFKAEFRRILNEPAADGESHFRKAVMTLLNKSGEGDVSASNKIVKFTFDLEKDGWDTYPDENGDGTADAEEIGDES